MKNSPKLSIKARAAVSFRYRNAFLIFTFEPIPSDNYHSTFFFWYKELSGNTINHLNEHICWVSACRVHLKTCWKHHKVSHPRWFSWRELCLIVSVFQNTWHLFHASPSQCVLRSVRSLFNFELMLEETAALAWLTSDYIIKTFRILKIVAIAKKIRTDYTWTFQLISQPNSSHKEAFSRMSTWQAGHGLVIRRCDILTHVHKHLMIPTPGLNCVQRL